MTEEQTSQTTMEAMILAASFKERGAYESAKAFGTGLEFSPIAGLIFGAIGRYYETDNDIRECSRDFIEARLIQEVKNPKHAGPISDVIRNLPSDVSPANIKHYLLENYKGRVGGKLSLALANGAKEEEVSRLIQEYSKASAVESTRGSTDLVDVLDTSDLLEEKSDVDFIRLWPKGLNDRLDGGTLRGHHILLFARPECGKTLFAINLCAGFLAQKLRVLYVGNEEPAHDIRDRIRARLLKVSRSYLRNNREECALHLSHLGAGYLRLIGDSNSFGKVRRELQKGAYDAVMIDQLRNMRLKSESRTAELEAAGIEARAIAKEFSVLVVSVTQAGDSATGKIYLSMSDIDSSKTGLPASADLIIGLGGTDDMKSTGQIGVSLCKNKMSGDHAQFLVTMNYQTGVIS